MKLIQLLLLSGALFNIDVGSAQGYEILGGKPIIIVFPSGYEKLNWHSNDFALSATVLVNSDSGKVSKITFRLGENIVAHDSKEIEKFLPAWQKPFLDRLCDAVFQWKFQKLERVDGGAPGKEIGRFFTYRFVRGTRKFKVEIKNYDGVVADDNPAIFPAPEGK